MCGALFSYGNSFKVPDEILPGLCGKMVKAQKFSTSPYLNTPPLHVVHRCGKHQCGLAYFAGFSGDYQNGGDSHL